MTEHRIPIVARGEVIEDYELTFNGRYGASFQCPDASKYLDRILLPSRREMEALYALSLDDVLDYLVEFGAHHLLPYVSRRPPALSATGWHGRSSRGAA